MAHNRSLRQQLNNPVSLLIELGTVSFAGAMMGFASKNPYTGILVQPYTLLSPANQVAALPLPLPATAAACHCRCPPLCLRDVSLSSVLLLSSGGPRAHVGHVRRDGGGTRGGADGRQLVRLGAGQLLARGLGGPRQSRLLYRQDGLQLLPHPGERLFEVPLMLEEGNGWSNYRRFFKKNCSTNAIYFSLFTFFWP